MHKMGVVGRIDESATMCGSILERATRQIWTVLLIICISNTLFAVIMTEVWNAEAGFFPPYSFFSSVTQIPEDMDSSLQVSGGPFVSGTWGLGLRCRLPS